MSTLLPDGSAFFVMDIDPDAPRGPPIKWNPWNKVVQDHRDGTIDHEQTNLERKRRGLQVPWTPEIGGRECYEAPIP